MALRDWTFRRILGLWTGWMASLLFVLLIAVVVSPTGVSISVSPPGLPLSGRIALGVVGFVVACLPPAALTYAWYVARLREWSERTGGTPTHLDPAVIRQVLADADRARALVDAPVHDFGKGTDQKVHGRGSDGAV